jgi:transcriptional regulator with XRE-family HTH domain
MTETNICGRRIRTARQRLGLTQHELAQRVQVTKQNITQLEQGQRQPRPDRLRALAQHLGVSADYLLGLTEEGS